MCKIGLLKFKFFLYKCNNPYTVTGRAATSFFHSIFLKRHYTHCTKNLILKCIFCEKRLYFAIKQHRTKCRTLNAVHVWNVLDIFEYLGRQTRNKNYNSIVWKWQSELIKSVVVSLFVISYFHIPWNWFFKMVFHIYLLSSICIPWVAQMNRFVHVSAVSVK